MHKRSLPRSRKIPFLSGLQTDTGFYHLRQVGARQVVPVFLCLVLLVGLNLVFAIRHSTYYWLVAVSLPFTALVVAAVYIVSDFLSRLLVWLAAASGRINAAFLSFFIYLFVMIVVYFILLLIPMKFLLDTFAERALSTDYQRWGLDLAAVQALILWVWSVARSF